MERVDVRRETEERRWVSVSERDFLLESASRYEMNSEKKVRNISGSS